MSRTRRQTHTHTHVKKSTEGLRGVCVALVEQVTTAVFRLAAERREAGGKQSEA